MTHLAPLLLAILLNALWQLPLLVAATLLCAHLLRPFGPLVQHRLWSASLVLQCTLPVLSTLAQPLPGLHLFPAAQHTGASRISILLGPANALHPAALPAPLQTALLLGWAVATLFFLVRFVFGLRTLAHLRRSAQPATLPPAAALAWAQARTQACAAIHPQPTLAVSPLVRAPLTLGLRRPLVLLPPHLLAHLAEADLLTLFAHECAHIRRHHFASNLALQLLALPFAFHPALAITRARLLEAREWACDAEAAHTLAGPRPFAASLLRLATLVAGDMPRPAHTVGLFTRNTLERRIMHLAQSPAPCSRPARLARLLACAALALGTAATALALHTPVDHHATAGAPGTPPLLVPGGVMAGEVLTRVPPVYPPDAKAARVQGSVRLQATISETGAIEHLRVLSGPTALRPSALDAVRQWTYKPYTFHGTPVPVQTVVTINYSLSN